MQKYTCCNSINGLSLDGRFSWTHTFSRHTRKFKSLDVTSQVSLPPKTSDSVEVTPPVHATLLLPSALEVHLKQTAKRRGCKDPGAKSTGPCRAATGAWNMEQQVASHSHVSDGVPPRRAAPQVEYTNRDGHFQNRSHDKDYTPS